MRTFLAAPVFAVALLAASVTAFASDDDGQANTPGDGWMTIAQITAKLTDQGYDVRQIKVEDNGYEVMAIDPNGQRIETHVDPLTGALLASDSDD
jgi:hypothetical protein